MKHSGKAWQTATRMILFALLGAVGLVAFGWVAFLIGAILKPLTGFLIGTWLVFSAFALYFFRDPEPIAPSDLKAIVAPAHGTIDVIDEITEPVVMGGPCRRISIFLSVFDVHVQNAPVYGKVSYLKHTPGLFLNAMRTDSAEHNENVLVGFDPVLRPGEKVGVRLIAGLIARRIVPWIGPEEMIPRSERIGLIRFGSRVELYLPLGVKIMAQTGQKVIGGQSILATYE